MVSPPFLQILPHRQHFRKLVFKRSPNHRYGSDTWGEILSTAILSLPLTQAGQLSVTGEIDCWPDMPDLPPPGEFGRHTLS